MLLQKPFVKIFVLSAFCNPCRRCMTSRRDLLMRSY